MVENLEKKVGLSACEIVMEAGMSDRPGYYSGRGATISDLNDKKLEKIYNIIARECGKEASKSFVQMVADIPVLSGTDFLINLYNLEGNKWQWDKELLSDKKGIYADNEGEAWGTVLSAMTMRDRNDTPRIRNVFLARHENDLAKLLDNSPRHVPGYLHF